MPANTHSQRDSDADRSAQPIPEPLSPTPQQQTPSSSETSNALDTYKTKPVEEWNTDEFHAAIAAPLPEELTITRSMLNMLKQDGYPTDRETLLKYHKEVTITEDEPELPDDEIEDQDYPPDDDWYQEDEEEE